MRTLGLFVAALVASLSLTSCSLIPGLGQQSGIQACAVVSSSVQTAVSEFTTALSAASSDPEAAAKAIDKLLVDLTAARAKVTNADVGAALDKAIAGLTTMSDELEKAGSDVSKLDSTKISAAAESVQTALTEFSTACTKG
jgi:hypothetical protein